MGRQTAERPSLILHSNPYSNNARKVNALLAEPDMAGLVVDRRLVRLLTGETRSPAFLALNPNGKVPLLVIDGEPLFESNAICVALAERAGSALWPTDAAARRRVLQWMFWQTTTLDRPCGAVVVQRVLMPMRGAAPDEAIVARELQAVRAAFAILDAHLSRARYMAGDGFTLADLAIAGSLVYADAGGLPVAEFEHLARWWAAVQARPSWQTSAPPPLPTG